MKTSVLEWIRKVFAVLPVLFWPPEDITTRDMRILGLLTWLTGLSLLFLLSAVMPVLAAYMINRGVGGLVIIMLLASYGLMSIGGYRMFTGKDEPWHMDSAEVSFSRILKIVIALIGAMLLAAGLIVAMLYIFELMGFDAKDWFR